MGRSLHNKIYLGRRTMLLNVERVRLVACVAAFAATGLVLIAIKNLP